MSRPVVVWFTGLPCSGKTTLAAETDRRLRELGLATSLLDGDLIRRTVSADLGYSDADRTEQARRAAALAAEEARRGKTVLVALLSPRRTSRAAARETIGDFVEVYVRCPLEVCEARDVKGMYRQARQGTLKDFTGVGAPYEAPERPEITLDTDQEDVPACVGKVIAYLEKAGHLTLSKG
jgi:adenylylsulfate kinase